jgi:universal stress protein A
MRQVRKILVPTDLSEESRRGLRYACTLAADENAALMVLHVANEFQAWEIFSDELAFYTFEKPWPIDRVLSEASLDLHRFLEPHLESMKNIPRVTKRVLTGPVAHQILSTAEHEEADLIVMSPRRDRRLRFLLTGSITDRVTRMSPCPVLSITPPPETQRKRGKLVSSIFGSMKPRLAPQP